MEPYYPHPYNPKNKAEIIRKWCEIRTTKCPIVGVDVSVKSYRGTFVEYTFVNKNKKVIHVPEFCLLVEWL